MANKIAGVYVIKNSITKKVYYGSSNNVHIRWLNHKSLLSRRVHANKKLQADYNDYGVESFEHQLLFEIEDRSQRLACERQLIDSETSQCYNTVRQGSVELLNAARSRPDKQCPTCGGNFQIPGVFQHIKHCNPAPN